MKRIQKWVVLIAGILTAILFVVCAHVFSPALPGAAGLTFRHNVEKDIDATALIYTESGSVADYLDSENGRYYVRLKYSE